MKRACVIFLAGILTVALGLPVSAAQPETGSYEVNNLDDPDVFGDACGEGADLVGVFEAKGRFEVFRDGEGNPTRIQFQEVFNGTFTRTDTGKSVRDPGRYTGIIDLVTGLETYQGSYWNIVYPGIGIVYHSVGRSVFTEPDFGNRIFQAGYSDVVNGKDLFTEVCDALA
ncbi:MAG: hypothetical protein OEX04_14775 [Acidimicrobiia bacterium]|nr:hypothetical protein [Acidimicrobiia bacterium]